mgnify:CR=1 FL=1
MSVSDVASLSGADAKRSELLHHLAVEAGLAGHHGLASRLIAGALALAAILGVGAASAIELELRAAIEPWHVLGEEATAGGTARCAGRARPASARRAAAHPA